MVMISDQGENKRLCLFDLRHPMLDEFELDPRTCLPRSTSLLPNMLL
jgi:hypothetical protein